MRLDAVVGTPGHPFQHVIEMLGDQAYRIQGGDKIRQRHEERLILLQQLSLLSDAGVHAVDRLQSRRRESIYVLLVSVVVHDA